MEKEKLVIIDGNSLANRAFFALPSLSNSEGVLTNAVYGFNMLILKIIKTENPDYIAVCFDKSGPLKRKDEFADYKAHRKPMAEELRDQMPLIKEYLTAMNIYQCELEGVEADDLIGTITVEAEKEDIRSVIFSADKDLLQLISDKTQVYLTKKGIAELETFGPQELMETYGLNPEQMIDLKGLMGDASDNIPGVPGVGEKTALKLMHEYGSMEAVYENIDHISGKKLNANLREFKDQAYMSRSLATIERDVDFSFSIEEMVFKEPDLEKTIEFYKQLEIKPDQFLDLFNLQTNIFADNEANQEPIYQLKREAELKRILEISPFKELVLYPEMIDKEPVELCFMIEGVAYKINLGPEDRELFAQLGPYLANPNIQKIAWKSKEIYKICKKHGLLFNGLNWDPELMAYLLNPEEVELSLAWLADKYLGHSLNANLQTEKLLIIKKLAKLMAEKLDEDELLLLFSGVELPLAKALASMEYEGVKIDREALNELSQETGKKINRLTNEIYIMAGEEFNINSPKQLAVILFEKLELPAFKKTKTGYSTNAEVLEELRPHHEIIDKILEYRMLNKLKGTYIDGFENYIDPKTNKIHTHYNQTVTATGRLSSTDPNLQNIPVRTEEGRKIRKIFIPAKEGNVLIAADYSQIELRILAHVSGDRVLLSAFQNMEDIHRKTASEVFGLPLDEVTSDQRRAAKAINFGIIYGQTDYGLSRELGISRQEAQDYINLYFERYQGVKEWIEKQIKEARLKGYVTTLLGRRRYLKDINSKNYNLRSFAERAAVNSTLQGTAADVIKLAMLKIHSLLAEKNYKSKMIMQIHDELVFEVPPQETARLIPEIKENMENAYPLLVPLIVDINAGFNLHDMEKI